MRELSISGTNESPSVQLQANGNVVTIEGRSTSPVAAGTFRQISLWVDELIAKESKLLLRFEIKLEHYNTLTSRLLLDLFLKLEKMKDNGHTIQIDWHYDVYDNDLKEAGSAYSSMVRVPFVLVART